MRATVNSKDATPAAPSSNCRLEREWKTVTAMIRIYCRDQHGANLCPDCQDLTQYVRLRLTHCRFGEEKPTCAKCPVHCYQRDRRKQIKEVMRYAGPRMMWEHPWLSLRHLLDGWGQNRETVICENGKLKQVVARRPTTGTVYPATH
jgi:hypothetical protein